MSDTEGNPFCLYQPEDLEAVLALHRSAIEGFNIGINPNEEEADLRQAETVYGGKNGRFLVRYEGEQLIAMGGFRRLSAEVVELKRMRIHVDWQGKGIGSQLLRALEHDAAQSGVKVIQLDTATRRPKTLEFYKKHGYLLTGSSHYGNVELSLFSKNL